MSPAIGAHARTVFKVDGQRMWPCALMLSISTLFLVSCYDLDARINLEPRGSGTLAFSSSLSSLCAHLAKDPGSPYYSKVPTGLAELRESLASVKGMSLVSGSESSDATRIGLRASLGFESLNALSNYLRAIGLEVTVLESPGSISLSFKMAPFPKSPPDQDIILAYKALFSDWSLNLVVEYPGSGKTGSIKAQSANFSAPSLDLLTSEKGLLWEVSFKKEASQ